VTSFDGLDLRHGSVNTTTVLRSAIEKSAWRDAARPFRHLWYRPSRHHLQKFKGHPKTRMDSTGTRTASWIGAQSNVRLFRRRTADFKFQGRTFFKFICHLRILHVVQFVFYWLALDNDRIDRWLKPSWFRAFFPIGVFSTWSCESFWLAVVFISGFFTLNYSTLSVRPLFLLHCRILVFLLFS
jgi:hypothetical protein